jgi:peptide methionine sulfoxide reductase msrA/msrB
MAEIPIPHDYPTAAQGHLFAWLFLGVEAYMARSGVADVTVGYANGRTDHPTYEDVCHRNTGHAETARVLYDPARITLADLLRQFFQIIDPTSRNRQGNDFGTQYRTAIFYTDATDHPVIHQIIEEEQKKHDRPIVTQVEPLRRYDLAEEYHQDYLEKNPNGYCHVTFDTLPDPGKILLKPGSSPATYPKPPDAYLKKHLSRESYAVTQENATERPFTGRYWNHADEGLYVDIVTGEPLFSRRWTSSSPTAVAQFCQPVEKQVIVEKLDKTFGMVRTEVRSRPVTLTWATSSQTARKIEADCVIASTVPRCGSFPRRIWKRGYGGISCPFRQKASELNQLIRRDP